MDVKGLIRSDAHRYGYQSGQFMLYLLTPGFRYSFWLRKCQYYHSKKVFLPFFIFALWRLRHYRVKYGIQIPRSVTIGAGLYIGHFGEIVINSDAIIGDNLNISQGVTIGISGRGNKRGVPIIGNKVYIGPGAKIFGKIVIGNNVAIGANAVVNKDVPDNAVVAGVPAKIISFEGSEGYCNNLV